MNQMKKQIQLGQQVVEYTLKVSWRARRLRLTVYHGGDFVVTAPQRLDKNLIEPFITAKSQWVIDKLDQYKDLRPPADPHEFTRYKEVALALATGRVRYFADFYRVKFNHIKIRRQKTRWGSCSRKGNLSFNYKIALLPPRLADYLIVHEVCHLAVFNHSPRFWSLVSQTMPDHLALRKEFKKVI